MKRDKTDDDKLMEAYLRQLDDNPSQQQVIVSRQHYQYLAQMINALRIAEEAKKVGGKKGE